MELLARNPDFVSAQLYFGDPGRGGDQKLTAQALGVFGYINAMLNDLFTGIFEDPYPGGAISMRRLVRERGKNQGKTVVFIEYDLSAGEVLGPMYRLLIDLAMKEALGQNTARNGNVFFVVDEFKLLPNLMHIDDALNFGRSLGVKVFAGLQSIDQLFENYGE
jgi:type IV secretory pathway TraG/TraD family ATPase VirD4